MTEEHYYLCWLASERCHLYARLDDGRVTWTPRLEKRPNCPADTIATKMTFAKAVAVRATFYGYAEFFVKYQVLHENYV